MTEPPDNPEPQQPSFLEILNGGAGGDAQFAALKTVTRQQIDGAFSLFRVLGAGRVGGMSSSTEQFLFLK